MRRASWRAMQLASVCCLVAWGAGAAPAGPAGADDDAVKTALAAFKKVKDTKDPGPRIDAIRALADHPDPKVVGALARYLMDPRENVPEAAADVIGQLGRKMSDKDRLSAVKALGSCKATGRNDAAVQAACKALSAMGDVRAVPGLVALLGAKTPAAARAAVEALGDLPAAAAVGPLIDLLGKVEPPSGGGGGGSKGSSQTPEQAERTKQLQQPCLEALKQITGAENKTAADWKKWWKSNQARFKPKPPKNPPEPPAEDAGKDAPKKGPEKKDGPDDDPPDDGGDDG